MTSYAQKQPSESLRFQESLKRLHDAENRCRVEVERSWYLHHASMLPILDDYIRGKLALLFEMRSRKRIDTIRRLLGNRQSVSGRTITSVIFHLNAADVDLSQSGDQKPMFVSVCKVVNGPDGCIPSIMRLYLLDKESEKIGAMSVYVPFNKLPLKFFGGFINRKLGEVPIKRYESKRFDGLKPGIVQRAVKVVNRISDDQRDLLEKRFAQRMAELFCTSVRANIHSGGVTVFKVGHQAFDLPDMYIGPLNLSPRLKEIHASRV